MAKAEIIQRLLEEKHITVEEAMTLMTQDPIPMPVPVNPYAPPYRPYLKPMPIADWTYDPNRDPIRFTNHTGNPHKPVYETTSNSNI